jgi:hypothetical protein
MKKYCILLLKTNKRKKTFKQKIKKPCLFQLKSGIIYVLEISSM